jgi:two-component system chemotaxis sensor kinase CheA
VVGLLLQTHDFVKGLIESPDQQGTEVDVAQLLTDLALTSQGELKPPRLGEILVSQGKVSEEDLQEALQDQKPIGEILVDRKKVTKEDLQQALDRQAALRVEKAVTVEDTVRVERSELDHLLKLAGELAVNRDRFLFLTQKMRSDPEAPEIQDELKKATASLEEMGKRVELKMLGGATRVDRAIVERLGDPLLHLVRNAIDHGIETPAERRELSKSETGLVTVRAFYDGQNLMIEVEDDGRGMSPAQIRKHAAERGMLTNAEAQALDEVQALDLIFAPGFSTAAEVTGISGRGVGLDVVKRNLQSLNGHVTTTTSLQQGTKFSLRLPLTPATLEATSISAARD